MPASNPRWPFLILFILPIIAALASFAFLTLIPQCGGYETWWEAKHVRLAFLPGVLSIFPLACLFSGSLPARQAGGIAGLMGAAQFALPQAALAYYAAVSGSANPVSESQIGNPSCTVSVFLLPWLAPSMVILWVACVIIGIVALGKLTHPIENAAQ